MSTCQIILCILRGPPDLPMTFIIITDFSDHAEHPTSDRPTGKAPHPQQRDVGTDHTTERPRYQSRAEGQTDSVGREGLGVLVRAADPTGRPWRQRRSRWRRRDTILHIGYATQQQIQLRSRDLRILKRPVGSHTATFVVENIVPTRGVAVLKGARSRGNACCQCDPAACRSGDLGKCAIGTWEAGTARPTSLSQTSRITLLTLGMQLRRSICHGGEPELAGDCARGLHREWCVLMFMKSLP